MRNEARKTISEMAVEIKTVYSDHDANILLDLGWCLFGMPIWSEALTSPVFFMVRLED